MNAMTTTIRLPFCVLCLNCVAVLAAAEWTPIGIWSDGDVFPTDDRSGAIGNMIDGDPTTCARLLDDSRTGNRTDTTPPGASYPVSASFVLDLGASRSCVGIRFVSQKDWRALGPKDVRVFAADDAEGKTGLRLLADVKELPPKNAGYSVCVLWDRTDARYLKVCIDEAHQFRYPPQDLQQRRGIHGNTETDFEIRIAELTVLDERPADPGWSNTPDVAFPAGRLQKDWMMQDHGLDVERCFASPENAEVEKAMLEKVLAGLKDAEIARKARAGMDRLLAEEVPGRDPRWKELYFDACEHRRRERLDFVRNKTDKIVYAKHYLLGGSTGLSPQALVSDEQYHDRNSEFRPGGQLCLLTLREDGSVGHEILLETREGMIRDPNLSFDGKMVVFAMRRSFVDDDYHLYTMDLDERKPRQITFTPEKDGRKYPCADFEPCLTPAGDIIFASTRHAQINDCWPNQSTNLFRCDKDGKHIRRLGFDELDVNNPKVLEDGRIIFTRWEYSDRNAYFLHPLFTMNSDGTMQTEYCGNNSTYPASYIHARPIRGSNKVVSIISGHHTARKGKLALIDRTLGTQDGKCIEYVAGASPDGTPGRKMSTVKAAHFADLSIDFFGQDGPQYQYPYAFDEDHYLVSFCPEGLPMYPRGRRWKYFHGPFTPPMGVYFMNAEGERELLAFDWKISCATPLAVVDREPPPIKPDQADPTKNFGTFVVQDVYIGPGLQGIPRGTIKRLRVVALEYKAAKIGQGRNAGEVHRGIVQTPISYHDGTWDIKHVLGEVDIEKDGSVAFEVPARTPVYFQLLDEKGHSVQSMRSWSTLQGGETFACLGCHEDKAETTIMPQSRSATLALRKAPQKLKPMGTRPHPLMVRLENESCLDSIENYWTVNIPPESTDPDLYAEGFSYTQEIQPIFDRHCIVCHTGDVNNPDPRKASPLSLTGEHQSVEPLKPKDDHYEDYKRNFTQSYLVLTNYGRIEGSKYLQWLGVRSRSEMLPPYHTGACKSPLMKYLEPEHYGVQVSDYEKRTLACWIDILIPFCGSLVQANTWTEAERAEYLYFIQKRRFFAEQELEDVRQRAGNAAREHP